ncbi:STAS domain-containing protein [Lutimonas saemankumensis]|uniref:STAS domain-containing protein n=1 Tax=Lutimonas saemankumensis TaxID=483016 RepID=UPI001CD812DB|nr:STAS domain-containing protein [Lutimonas saemankumensis]MCA0930860.1 STAS domain-containing protein [Lutimonas saemankumensis]
MSLEIKLKEIQDKIVIAFIGTLDTNTSPVAEDAILELLDKGTKKMLIDLEQTRYVSSAGLRVFLATAKRIMANSGTLTLCHPNEIVKDILTVSGFNTIIDVSPTVKDALNDH